MVEIPIIKDIIILPNKLLSVEEFIKYGKVLKINSFT